MQVNAKISMDIMTVLLLRQNWNFSLVRSFSLESRSLFIISNYNYNKNLVMSMKVE